MILDGDGTNAVRDVESQEIMREVILLPDFGNMRVPTTIMRLCSFTASH
jgi:hypothetical protein